MLKSARVRRESYVGPWLPEPLLTGPDAAAQVLMDESVSTAMLVVMETLTPAERVALVLHDVFNFPFSRIAQVLGSGASELTRQISDELDHLGRVSVDQRLRALPEVFVAGDTAASAFDAEHTVMQACQHATPLGKVAGYNAAADLLDVPLRDFTPGPYVTCLDLGGAGAIFTRGWDRRLMASGADGADVKKRINQHIHPPVDDASRILAAADRVYIELPLFPRDEEKTAPAA